MGLVGFSGVWGLVDLLGVSETLGLSSNGNFNKDIDDKLLVFRVPKFADHVFLYREIVVKKSVILVFSRFSSYPWMTGCWFHVFFLVPSLPWCCVPQKVEKIYPQGLRLSNMGMVNPSFLYDCPFKTTICREFPIATMFDFRMGERKTITINILWLICSFVFMGSIWSCQLPVLLLRSSNGEEFTLHCFFPFKSTFIPAWTDSTQAWGIKTCCQI